MLVCELEGIDKTERFDNRATDRKVVDSDLEMLLAKFIERKILAE